MAYTGAITTLDELDALYGEPSPKSLIKELDHVSEHYRAFIAHAPYAVLATCGPEGLDCSPRGDPPGFVRVADPRTLLISLFTVTPVSTDATGAPILYVRQKALAFKESVTVYRDESQQTALYTIAADRVIDFNAVYRIRDGLGREVGALARRGRRSSPRGGPGGRALAPTCPWPDSLPIRPHGPSPCDRMVSKARAPARKISFSPVTDFNLP